MGVIRDIVREAARGAVRGFAGVSPGVSPSTTIHNYISPAGQFPPAQNLQGGWVQRPDIVAEPSDLEISFSSGEEDYEFTVDQPVMLHVFSLTNSDLEVTGLTILGNTSTIEVEPDIFGVLAVVFMDEDLDEVDGVGFGIADVDDYGLIVELEVAIIETDEDELDDILEDLDDALAELAGA